MKKWLVFNIGCTECGVSSNIVGIFTKKVKANTIAKKLQNSDDAMWRQGGQNQYEVFEIPDIDIINQEYQKFL